MKLLGGKRSGRSSEIRDDGSQLKKRLREHHGEIERHVTETTGQSQQAHEAHWNLEQELERLRKELKTERTARAQAEATASKARQEAEGKARELAESERQFTDALERGVQAIIQLERKAQAERNRAEQEAGRQAERRAAEVWAAEQRVAEANLVLEDARAEAEQERQRRAALERRLQSIKAAQESPAAQAQSASRNAQEPTPGSEPKPGREAQPAAELSPPPAPPAPAPSRDEAERESRPPDVEARRTPPFHEPPPRVKSSRFRRRRRRLARRRRGVSDSISCPVCGTEAATSSEWEQRRSDWIATDDNGVCPDCQADGWLFPAEAAIPFRRLSERQ